MHHSDRTPQSHFACTSLLSCRSHHIFGSIVSGGLGRISPGAEVGRVLGMLCLARLSVLLQLSARLGFSQCWKESSLIAETALACKVQSRRKRHTLQQARHNTTVNIDSSSVAAGRLLCAQLTRSPRRAHDAILLEADLSAEAIT